MAKGKKTSLVEYGDYTEEDAEADMAEQKKARGGQFFKFPEGKTRMRIVPALLGKKWKVAVQEHFFDVPGVGAVKFVCPRAATKGKRSCKACTREKKLRESGSPADEQSANNMRAKRRVYTHAVIRSAEEDGVCVVPFGPMIEGELTDLRNGGVNFVNPEDGCDVIVIKRVSGGRTNYKVVAADKGAECPLSRDVAQANDWIENSGDLTRFTRVYTDEQIAALMRGERLDDRRASSAGGSSASKTIGDDMDDDDEEDDDDDDDEEDEDEEFTF